jgi:hypothetical protein
MNHIHQLDYSYICLCICVCAWHIAGVLNYVSISKREDKWMMNPQENWLRFV